MSDQSKTTAKARVVQFDPSQAFPANDPLTIPLLRLMMATDDARHLQILLTVEPESVDDANQIEQGILEGQLGHLFRLLSSHLYEAGIAFRRLEQAHPNLLDAAVAVDERGPAALDYVRRAYDHSRPDGLSKAFLDPIRNRVGFHYPRERKLREAFERHVGNQHLEGALTLVEFFGLGRYNVTDRLITLLIADELGVRLEEFLDKFRERVGEVIALAGSLADVVDRLLLHVLEQHPGAITEVREGAVTVSPFLQRAREKVEKERSQGPLP